MERMKPETGQEPMVILYLSPGPSRSVNKDLAPRENGAEMRDGCRYWVIDNSESRKAPFPFGHRAQQPMRL